MSTPLGLVLVTMKESVLRRHLRTVSTDRMALMCELLVFSIPSDLGTLAFHLEFHFSHLMVFLIV